MLVIKTQDFEPVYLKFPSGEVGTVRATKKNGHLCVVLEMPEDVLILRRELWDRGIRTKAS